MNHHSINSARVLAPFDIEKVDFNALSTRDQYAVETGTIAAPNRDAPFAVPKGLYNKSQRELTHEDTHVIASNFTSPYPFMPVVVQMFLKGNNHIYGERRLDFGNDEGVTSAGTIQVPGDFMKSAMLGLVLDCPEMPNDTDMLDIAVHERFFIQPRQENLGLRGVLPVATMAIIGAGKLAVDPSDSNLDLSTTSPALLTAGEKWHPLPSVDGGKMQGSEYGCYLTLVTNLHPDVKIAAQSEQYSSIVEMNEKTALQILRKQRDPLEVRKQIQRADRSPTDGIDISPACGGFCIDSVLYLAEHNKLRQHL